MTLRTAAIGLLSASGLALGTGCSQTGDSSPDAGACALGAVGFASGAPDPENPCRSCQPQLSSSAFSPLAEGTPCGPGGAAYCHLGGCRAGCFIGGAFQAEGASDPARACRTCDPSRAAGAWSTLTGLPRAEECGASEVCWAGTCTAGCFIGGVASSQGATNPTNPCQICNAPFGTSRWWDLPDGTPCGAGGQCNGGLCEQGCSIGNALYPASTPDPGDACRSCQPEISTSDWSPFSGVPPFPCDGGQICDRGVCTGACWIDGGVVAPGLIPPGQPCLACSPAQNPAAFSPFTGDPFGACGPGEVCELGSCRSGCFIDGGYAAAGAFQTGGAMLCCGPADSTSGWTSVFFPGAPYDPLWADNLLAGDIDGDGFTDLVVARFGSGIQIFFGDGDAGLRKPPLQTALVPGVNMLGVSAVALADLDGNGLLDLVFGTTSDGGVAIGVSFFVDGGFGAPDLYPIPYCLTLAVGDFDGDRHPDVAVSSSNGIQLLMNQGDGGLVPGVLLGGLGAFGYGVIAAGDFDGDGNVDIAAARGLAAIWFGDGGGGFPGFSASTPDFSSVQSCSVVGSLDGTGRQEMVVGSSDVQMLQRIGATAAQKIEVVGYFMPQLFSVALADLNGDGLPDVVATGDFAGGGNLGLMINSGGQLLLPRNLQLSPAGGFGNPSYLVATGRFEVDAGPGFALLIKGGALDAGLVLYRSGCR